MDAEKIYNAERKYIVANDLARKRTVSLTVKDVTLQTFSNKERLVLSFKETNKELVLNQTNARMMSNLTHSDETDEWLEKRITLLLDKTVFEGNEVQCVRIAPDLV